MKTIIAGCRDFGSSPGAKFDIDFFADCMSEYQYPITEIVSGGAKGADRLGEIWAKAKGIPLKIFYADWTKYGRRAGPIRNAEMGDYADALIVFWDGKSRGTKNMIDYAKKKNLTITVYRYDNDKNTS